MEYLGDLYTFVSSPALTNVILFAWFLFWLDTKGI